MALKNERGTLAKIATAFSDAGVDLQHLHSQQTTEGVVFVLGLDRSPDDEVIRNVCQLLATTGVIKTPQ